MSVFEEYVPQPSWSRTGLQLEAAENTKANGKAPGLCWTTQAVTQNPKFVVKRQNHGCCQVSDQIAVKDNYNFTVRALLSFRSMLAKLLC